MSEVKQPEGFIPAGLVVEIVRGKVEGGLRIAGEVERMAVQLRQLHLVRGGEMKAGQVEADSIIIDGRVSGMTFITPRLTVSAGAHVSDCVVEMGSLTGCTIHADACFEGEIRISVPRKGGGKAGGLPRLDALDTSPLRSGIPAAGRAIIPAGDDEPDLHWPEKTPDISEADKDADIPLGG